MDPLPLSALNDFLFCPRRAGLKFIEGLRGTNEHTVLGDLAYEHVDPFAPTWPAAFRLWPGRIALSTLLRVDRGFWVAAHSRVSIRSRVVHWIWQAA